MTLVLNGEYSILRGGKIQVLRPGEMVLEMLGEGRERWDGPNVELFVMEWQTEREYALTTGHMGALDFEKLQSLIFDLEDAEHLCEEQFLRFIEMLNLPEPRWIEALVQEAFCYPQRDVLVPLASLLGETLSSLHENPMWVNVLEKLEVSERQARRQLRELLTLMGLPAAHRSLRSYLHRIRVTHAASFLRVGGATVSQVARSLGYGSDRALSTALRQAGLGSPSALRQSE